MRAKERETQKEREMDKEREKDMRDCGGRLKKWIWRGQG
jgi:hypothetical protein